MEPALFILTAISLVLVSIAIILWMILLAYRLLNNRTRIRRARIADEWLTLILPVLEEVEPVQSLPKVHSREVMEAVLALLRKLAERFRGQYRDRLQLVLQHIGGEEYGLRMLRRNSLVQRLRGCALLAWTGSNPEVDNALLQVLINDHRPEVRIEAASALALRRAPRVRLTEVMTALRAAAALRSERARDIIRMLAPGRSGELMQLLAAAEQPREKILLLDACSLAGNLEMTGLIAMYVHDPDPGVRAAAVRTLERLGDPGHLFAVAALAEDGHEKVRTAVARYAISMGSDSVALNILKHLSFDSNFDVQRVAVHGLAAVGGPQWRALIPRFAGEPPLLAALMDEADAQPMPL